MTRAPFIATAIALCACDYNRAFTDYCIESGACSCVGTDCCIHYGYSCHTGYPCCEGFVCKEQNTCEGTFCREIGTCRRPVDPVLELTPANCDFGWVDLGETRTANVTLANVGPGSSTPLVFGDLRRPFRVDASACSGQVLAPGSTCPVAVSVEPTVEGRFSDALRVEELVSRVQLLVQARSGF
jgi:hypothetical protein